MSTKKSFGLGKGMSSLLENFDYNKQLDNVSRETLVTMVSLEKIVPNSNQPRKNFEEESLKELSESIKNQGIIQPIIVELIGNDVYSIIAGERRFRAAKLAGLLEVPVIVKEYNSIKRIEVSLIENIQRENLNSLEEAKAYQYLIQESSYTQEEISKHLGKSRSSIANSLRLLQLSEEMQADLNEGRLTAGHARAILSLINPSDRELLRNKILNNNLSVREAEKKAEEYNKGKKQASKKKKNKDLGTTLQEAEDNLFKTYNAKIEISGNTRKGKIVFNYSSEKELTRIYKMLVNKEINLN